MWLVAGQSFGFRPKTAMVKIEGKLATNPIKDYMLRQLSSGESQVSEPTQRRESVSPREGPIDNHELRQTTRSKV